MTDMASERAIVTTMAGLRCLPVSNYEKASTSHNGRDGDYSTFSRSLGAITGGESRLSLALNDERR